MLPGTHLLIDGKNILYRAIFARTKDSPVEVFFRIIQRSIRQANATSFHIFWDCPRSETWRRKLYPPYKAQRKESDPEIGEAIGINLKILKKLVPLLGFRQYYCDKLEADDLVYAFASMFHPTDLVVLSSDRDLLQIPFRFLNARQLQPAGEFYEKPLVNPVLEKCLTGDKSDNIEGYHGIGPKKAAKMLADPVKLHTFVQASPRTFLFNMNIVDLSLCPYQMRAQYTVLNGIREETKFDLNAARGILGQHNMYPALHELDWSTVNEE